MAAVFLTPHGARLVKVPFISTEYASIYIDEISRPGAREYLSYGLSPDGFTHQTAFNLLLAAAVLAALGAAARRELRLSHLLLLAGGLVLLTKAVRLSHECSLLALPLIRSYGPLVPPMRLRKKVLAVPAAVALLALATPFVFLWHRLPEREQSYPLSLKNLPHGIVSFLNGVEAEGRVMNNPNVGGYLQWALEPRYKIFMDLEIPFLFADEDMYEVASAFFDPHALARFLDRYHPTWIAATLASGAFPALIAAHPAYVAVFFDDQGVLYVDRGRYGGIAERHALAHVDPWTLGRTRFSALSPEERLGAYRELRRMSEIDPGVSSVNQALAILDNLAGRHDQALEHARRVIAKDPDLARGHAIRGDALFGQGAFETAAASYRRALKRSAEETERRSIYRSLSAAWRRAERPRKAYEALKRGVGIFNIEASYRELYELGVLAAAAGEPHEARKMFTFALVKVPPEEADLRRTIEEHLAVLPGGRKDR
jgi:tetratricopeptide (TPR) repeat protein